MLENQNLGPDASSTYAGNAWLVLGQALQAAGRASEARAAFITAGRHLAAAAGDAHPSTKLALQLASGGPPPGRPRP